MAAILIALLLLPRSYELALEPAARAIFRDLLHDNRNGFSHIEQAVFIVRGADGELRAVRWPPDGQPNAGRWEGAYPPGAIAIAHTHPNWLPLPSATDAAAARQAGLPIYVVTPDAISKTTGAAPVTIVSGVWEER